MPTLEKSISIEIIMTTRDRLRLEAKCVAGILSEIDLRVVGCPELLEMAVQWRANLVGSMDRLQPPQENTHAAMMFRELVQRLKGEWEYPYVEEELCHCRQVPTQVVDEAVIMGAESVVEIARTTSAGTGCGTCRPDIEKIIGYRRVKSQKGSS